MITTDSLSNLQVAECQSLIKSKVKRFFGRNVDEHEFEDVCSKTMLQFLIKLVDFDPHRASLKTFLSRIAESCFIDIRRAQTAKMRDSRQTGPSLNSLVVDDDGRRCELGETLDEQVLRCHCPVPFPTNPFPNDLGLDLRHEIAKLGPMESSLVECYCQGWSVAEIACEFGVERGTIYRRLRNLRKKMHSLSVY